MEIRPLEILNQAHAQATWPSEDLKEAVHVLLLALDADLGDQGYGEETDISDKVEDACAIVEGTINEVDTAHDEEAEVQITDDDDQD